MGVVPLGHTGVSMAKVCGNYWERCASLQQVSGVRVAQDVEARRRIDPGATASLAERAMLVRSSPWQSVRSGKNQLSSRLARDMSLEERHAVFGQHYMTRPACFAGAHADRAGVAIEVRNPEIHDLAVSTAR